jgi:hypothetical protein
MGLPLNHPNDLKSFLRRRKTCLNSKKQPSKVSGTRLEVQHFLCVGGVALEEYLRAQ